jgi:hypothetical protein
LLEPAARSDFPGIDRDEAALVLDGYLVGLSRQEAARRLRLGELAGAFLRRRTYHWLGFARLNDYSTERLGISGREVQSLAQVWQKVSEIEALADAYREGRLNWTKLRLLSTVVSPNSAERWIDAARRHTSRELAAMVARGRYDDDGGLGEMASPPGDAERAADRDTSDAGAGGEQAPDPSDSSASSDPGYSADRSGPSDPSDTTGSVDLFDLLEGEPRARLRIRCPARVRSLWRTVFELASRSAGSVLAQWQALELVAAEAMSGVDLPAASDEREALGQKAQFASMYLDRDQRDRHGDRDGDDHCSGYDRHDEDEDPALAELRMGQTTIHEIGMRLGIPVSNLMRVAKSEDEPPLDERTPVELDAELRTTLGGMQAIDWQMGCLLRTFQRLGLYRHRGYRSMAVYVAERLGISPRKARGLVRLESNGSAGQSELAQAYRTGRISWVRALVLLPIVSDAHARAWIERACEVTVRRLIEEVGWASDLRDRAGQVLDLPPPPLGAPLERSDAEAERQMRARFDCETVTGILARAPELDVALSFCGPASVMALVADVLRAYTGSYEAPWRGFERMLLHAKGVWEAVPRHTNPIHERDEWRCRVPACSSRQNLQEHHLLFRSQGGGNGRDNRVSICAWHHLRGIHKGVVRAHGEAGREIRWQLGLGAGASGEAFLSFRNDVYAEG